MNRFCPNYKIKEVFDSFNEMVEALGGKPMTEEEFRSSALRLLRTGDDYAAVDAAYKIYNDNNGNFLDFAPNGEKSVLFQEILNRVGNREEAIRIKANIFSEKFKKNFGNWVENSNVSDVNEKELQSIKDDAIANGTFMKAPNGKPTNLTERQWLQVRTRAFKDWFGDWENPTIFTANNVDNVEALQQKYPSSLPNKFYHHSTNRFGRQAFDSREGNKEKLHIIGRLTTDKVDALVVENPNSENKISHITLATAEGVKPFESNRELENNQDKIQPLDDYVNTTFTNNLRNDVSKVVDENGEPLVVYHHTDNSNLTEFSTDFDNYFAKDGGTKEAIFFDENKTGTLNRKYDIPVFLNIKDLHEYNETKEQLHQRGITYRQVVNESAAENNTDGGVHMKDFDDNKMEHQSIWIVHNPNQIKSATDNSGEFSTENDDITDAATDVNGEPTVYALLSEEQREKELQTNSSDGLGLKHKFSFASPLSSFGAKNGALLLGGKTVSTKDILKHMYDSKSFSPVNVFLGQVLSNHDIPVRFQHLQIGTLMTTVSDENGGSVILIDPEKIEDVSNEYLADKLLHETVHAITVGAINNPKTEEEKRFLQINSKIFLLFDKLYPKDRFSRVDPQFYILTNEKEFAAEFATNEDARKVLFAKALEIDNRKTCLNVLKNFINSLSKLLINRNIFSTTEEKLKDYQNELQRYLIKKRPIIQGNISNKDLFKLAYQNISEQTAFADDMATLKEQWSRLIDSFETNNVLDFGVNSLNPRRGRLSTEEEARSDLKKLSLSVADMLRKRLAATRVSNLKEEIKTKNIQILQSQIQQFSSDTVSDFLAISNFLSQVSPQLLEDSKKIRRIRDKNLSTTDSDYMYYNHDYFAVYEKILGSIQSRLDEPSIKNEILRLMLNEPNLKNPVVNDVQAMIDLAKKTANLAGDSVKIMKQILINNIKQRIAGQINLTHDPTLIEYVEELELIGYDTSSLLRNMGSADMAKDSGLRMLYNIVSGANRKAERDAQSVQEDLNLLLSKLGNGESVMDLYELDENKQTTLYLVRDLNFGRFFKDYKKFLEDLNMELGIERLDNREAPNDESEVKIDAKSYMRTLDKLGVNYDKSELKIVDGDVLITKKEYFNFKKNLWLSEHCERKYKTSYYFAFNNLSPETREARDIIQGLIRNIKSRCLGEDGYYHYENLTDEEWKTLNQLYIQKRLLASDYDINGDLKTPGTVQYKIAKELQHLNEVLYKKEHKLQKDWDRWKEARNTVIRKAGGVKEMEKGRSADSNFDWKMLDEWDARNSKQQFKEDSEGNALLFKRIEEETAQIPIYELDDDGGARYEEITKEISELLSIYRNYNTGDIETLPKNIQVKLKKLIDEQEKIKRQAKRQNKQVKLASKQRAKVFAKYATYEYTKAYRKMLNHARAMDIDIPGYLDSFRKKTGKYKLVDDDEVVFRPYKWYTKVVVKPEYQEEFAELVPGDGWINTDDNDELLNDKFDNSYNMSYVPKRDLYDNSAAYKKIQQSESLRALYDKVLEVMRKSNEMLTNRMYHDDYLLPAIEGSLYKYAKNKGSFSGRTKAAWEWFKDNTGATASFDIDYGASVENILNGQDDLGEIQNEKVFDTGTIGTRPDGRQLNLVITPYTTKLLDPSKLSADLIGIVGQYYLMSSKFKYKTEVKDLAESLVDMMEYRSYTLDTRKAKDFFQKKRHVIDGVRSNTYKMARTFLDMNLYDIKTTTAEWHGINLGKLAALYKAFVTAVNLGCNIAVAGTGALTAWYSHLILAITGQHYSLHVAHLAGLEVSLRLLRNYGGVKYIGDLTTNDKLMILAEEFNIANQQEKKRSNTNRNRIIESVNRNKTFGMLSASDFIIKSQIMVSTLMSYRLVDGHFTTIEDIKMNGWNKPEEWVKEQTKKWNKGVCLYSVLDAKNHKFYVDPKYAKLYKEVEDIVHARIQKYAENADGMATPEQKALITQGFVGSCVLIHRQYLPLMINERFGHIVFDLDTLEYKNGDFRTIGNFVKGLLFFIASKNNRDAFKDMFFYDKVHKQELIGSLDVSEMLKALTSMVRRYQLKKVASELLLYNLVISPFVTYMISLSREDDKKDDLLFLLVTFILTRFMWESYTPYRMDDMINNIKSPSAATSISDKAEALAHSLYRTVFPQQTLWDTFFSGEEANKLVYDIYVKRGVYKKMPFPLNTKAGRDMFKLFVPAHNALEQWYGSREKENYYTKQIMKMKE